MTHAAQSGAPIFTIEHELEIAASAQEVWAVLADFDGYPEWNPYVLAISGELAERGGLLEITIVQSNWTQPLTLQPVLVEAEANRILHWQGRVGDRGILDTDHSFHIEALADDRVRFTQREEFRGTLAEGIDDTARACTHDAFRAMNEALSERVQALK